MEKEFYKFKEFCRLSNLSRRALLLYEKMQILIPEKIDAETGYRYYGKKQLYTASIIAFLKNLDVPLAKIEEIIGGKQTIQQYLAASRTRLTLLDRQIKINNALKTLALLEQDDLSFTQTAISKVIPECNVLTYEAWGKTEDLSLYINFMTRFVQNHSIQPIGPFFIYFFHDSTETEYHFKVCLPVKEYWNISSNEIRWETFPPINTLAMRCYGSYELLPQYYKRLDEILAERSISRSGEYIETYLISGDSRYTDSSTYITEIAAVVI
jgi:DNA-binding transcriptional MerR regulator